MMMWYLLYLLLFAMAVLGLCVLSEVLWALTICILPIIEPLINKIEKRFTKN